jgi:biotin carboxyl carrier protein
MIAKLLIAAFVACVAPAWGADEHGHSHGEAAPPAGSNGPSRQPDGSVFLPKPAQRQLSVRTALARPQALARSVELAGKVTMDPNAGGKVQATSPGRVEPGPRGLPIVGQAVRKGEVLAYVLPSTGPLERSVQSAQLAELRASRTLAEKRLARLQALSDTVPRKEIEAAEAELASLGARASAVNMGLSGREALVAPVAGVVASAHVVAGQVVDARELLYDIVDPGRLGIEALSFDAALASDIGGASLAIGGERVPLRFLGAARTLREQALPLSFTAQAAVLSSLAVGQPVKVFVQTRSTVQGMAVPAASLMRNPSNQTIVWVKTAAERFEPRVVSVEPLDGVSVAVTKGLAPGDRVVTQGAALVNQVR